MSELTIMFFKAARMRPRRGLGERGLPARRAFRRPPLRSGLLQARRGGSVHLCSHTVHLCSQRDNGKLFHLPSGEMFDFLSALRGFGESARWTPSEVLINAERIVRYTMEVYNEKSAKL